jgi:hypothetical protein
MPMYQIIVRRTLLVGCVVAAALVSDDSIAANNPTIQPKQLQKGPTVTPSPKVKPSPEIKPVKKAPAKEPVVHNAPQTKIDPKIKPVELSKIQPLSKQQIVSTVAAQGIEIKPAELKKRVDLTPRRPWHNTRTYMSLMSGAWMPGQNPPSMSLAAGGPNGQGAFLELRIAAAKDTVYVIDCRVSATKRFFLKIRNLHHVIHPENGHVVHAIPALPSDGDHAVFISSDGAWTSSGCSITPAVPTT